MSLTQTPLAPTTLLAAVNELLSCVRLAGVMSLMASEMNEDAAEAKRAIDTANVEMQSRGWAFNTEPGAVLDPDAKGEVHLPQGTLKATATRCTTNGVLVQRGDRLFSPTKRSYALGTSVTVNLVIALPFEELPEAARRYVVGLAARRWALPRQPSGATFRYTEEHLAAAHLEMERADTDTLDLTLPMSSPHFQQMRRR